MGGVSIPSTKLNVELGPLPLGCQSQTVVSGEGLWPSPSLTVGFGQLFSRCVSGESFGSRQTFATPLLGSVQCCAHDLGLMPFGTR